jgi:pyruvate,water dikinase
MQPVEVADSPPTRMGVFVSVLVPERATVVRDLADGVSSLRNDYFLLQSGVHPARMVREGQSRILEDTIARGIGRTAALFAGKPVWYKTMDAPTDEFRRLAGGEEEPIERNPLLGWRGIGRELEEPEMLDLELRAVRRALGDGCRGLGVKLPFIRFVDEYRAVVRRVEELGMRPHEDVSIGVSIETPAAAAMLTEFLDEGADFVSVGVSDLAMCVLALDRESHKVADVFDPAHPAVVDVLQSIAETAREAGVFSCVCGESARDPSLLPLLVGAGYDAIGVSLSYFASVKQEIARLEGDAA